MIKLLPNNRVRMLISRHPDWKRGGPIKQSSIAGWDSSSRIWTSTQHVRSRDRQDRAIVLTLVQSLMKDFSDAIIRVGERDHQLRGEQSAWYSILVAARPVNPRDIPDGG